MANLIELLQNPSVFKIGRTIGTDEAGTPIYSANQNIAYGAFEGSKKIKNKVYSSNGTERDVPDYHLVDRVRWSYSEENADPIFLDGGKKSHASENGGLPDFMVRGGFETNKDRRRIDIKRISKLLYSSKLGRHFILRQGALQLLNPQENTRTFNAGASLLAQVAAADSVKFRRHGLVPTPVGTEKGVNETLGELLNAGNFLTNVLGGDYLDIKKETAISDPNNKFNLGDPSAVAPPDLKSVAGIVDFVVGDANPFQKKPSYDIPVSPNKLDKLSAQGIFIKGPQVDSSAAEKNIKDFVNFRFEVVDSNNPLYTKVIAFRAFLDSLADNFNASHNQIKFNGRGEFFYTYNNFKRTINISFKIAAQTRDEMKPIYQKLNFLAGQTAPNYSAKGRIRTPYTRLTLGDYLHRVPGLLNSVTINWNSNYSWEIALDSEVQKQQNAADPNETIEVREGLDKDMKVLPHILDVSIGFTPIHDFVPTNEMNTPFIGLDSNAESPSWLPYNQQPSDVIVEKGTEAVEIEGCTDPASSTYNPDATIDDGSCKYTVGDQKLDPTGNMFGGSNRTNYL